MSLRRAILSVSAVLLSLASAPTRAAEGPERFGEGVFTTPAWDFFVALTADQKTAYFCRANGSFSYFTILTSTRSGERWSEPRVAPFSGRWSDADPHLSPDGGQLFFISNRPIAAGDSLPRGDYDIWVCDRTEGGGWGEPRHIPPPVSLEGSTEWAPSPAANGNLYFGSTRPGGKGANDLYVAKWNGSAYGEPENLGDSLNTRAGEVEPWVAPDESYLLFSGQGRPDGLGGFDLYLSRRKDGVWQRPEHLGHGINSPGGDFNQSVSPDGKWLYFSSTRGSFDQMPRRRLTYAEMQRRLTGLGNGLGDIYRIELAKLGIAPLSP
jgi:Tol biopolymer transport system component